MENSNNLIPSLENYVDHTVIQVLNEMFKNVKIDLALGKAVHKFQMGYVNTSRDYVEFFGSNLLGVHVIRFRDSDVLRFFTNVLDIDFTTVKEAIRETKTIEHHRLVSSDIFNLTIIYLLHRVMAEPELKDNEKEWIARNVALIFFYRCIAALLSDWFRYPADPKLARVAYNNLSYKFLIKKLGSWHKVMEYRANEYISKTGVQYKKLVKMEFDKDLVDVINDGANSIRDMVKNYYRELDLAKQQGDRLGVTNKVGLDIDGEEMVKDSIRSIDKQIASIKHYLNDPTSFIKDEFVRVIIDINKNTSVRLLKETLVWVCANTSGKRHKFIDDIVTSIVVYSSYLIDTKIEKEKHKDLGYVIIQLKNLYLSSRSVDRDLLSIREKVDKMLKEAHEDMSTPLILATRTAFILYVTLRVLIGQKVK